MIRFDHVCKEFGPKKVLRDVSFDIQKGETFFIVGLSGAGKSVTLKHMIKLLSPTSGNITIGDDDLNEAEGKTLSGIRSRFGYLFQSSALLQWMTVLENVGLPLRENTSMKDAEIDALAMEVLKKVSLEEAADRHPSNISGGMQKRAGLARAIISEPEIILYDEPTSGLDPLTSRNIDQLIDQLRKSLDVTSVVVTHDMISALTIGSRIAMLHHGELVEVSTPEEFLQSDHETVRLFLDSQHIDRDFLERYQGGQHVPA